MNGNVVEIFDVFNRDVFQQVLRNPMAANEMLKFTAKEHCAENIVFLYKVEKFNSLLGQLSDLMESINEIFIVDEAPHQINIDSAAARSITRSLTNARTTTLPPIRHIFDKVHREIEDLLYMDVYPRFVRYKMAQSAARALAEDSRSIRYQGLGDCFCLTVPSLPDNPIVFASDGFIHVTGYQRKEIMNRNCRFLQGKYTDIGAVKSLRRGIHDRQDRVELLLNYRKDGTPFWNLLYVTPLIDANGHCAFFLGGQVNISTNIHDKLDILQILSYTAKVKPKGENNEQLAPTQNSHQLPKSQGFSRLRVFDNIRAALLSNCDSSTAPDEPQEETGMENEMLRNMQEMDLRTQIETFYAAYRRYMVLSYSDLRVLYHSPDLLNATKSPTSTSLPTPPSSLHCPSSPSSPPASPLSSVDYNPSQSTTSVATSNSTDTTQHEHPRIIAGTDVFKVLLDMTSNPKAIKTTRHAVRKALKDGNAISSRIDVLPPPMLTPASNGNSPDSVGLGIAGGRGAPNGGVRLFSSSGSSNGAHVRLNASRDSGFSYGNSNGSISGESLGSMDECEKVNIHWTPVKDENGACGLVIVMLGCR